MSGGPVSGGPTPPDPTPPDPTQISADDTAKPAVERRKRRWLRWLGGVLLLLVVLIVSLPAALFGMLSSARGTAWLIDQANQLAKDNGVEFSVVHRSGSLLQRLELADLHYAADGLRLDAARAVLFWHPRELLSRRLHVELLEVSDIALTPPPAKEEAPKEPTEPLSLPDITLPIDIQIDRVAVNRLTVQQAADPIKIDQLAFGISADTDHLYLRELTFSGMDATLNGAVDLALQSPHALNGALALHAGAQLTGEQLGDLRADAKLEGYALQPHILLTVHEPFVVGADAALKLDSELPAFDVKAHWDALQWPPRSDPQVTAGTGDVTFKGTTDDYRLTLTTRVAAPDLPPGQIDLTALGDLEHVELRPLSVKVDEGNLLAEGAVSWKQAVSWQLQLLAKQLNPAAFAPDWPGAIDADIAVDGGLSADGERLTVNAVIRDLGGKLRDYPLNGSGRVNWDAGRLLADKLKIASGPNRVSVDGKVEQSIDLAFDIDAPKLAALYPGLAGSLTGSGRVGGSQQQPTLKASLNGDALAFEQNKAQSLKLDVNWNQTGGDGSLRVEGIDAAGTAIDSVSADLSGKPEKHRLSLAMKGEPLNASLTAQGGWQEPLWRGTLDSLTLEQPQAGRWDLSAPTALQLGSEQARSEQLCLRQGASSLCSKGGWTAASGFDLSGALRNLDLAKFVAMASEATQVDGTLNADFALQGKPEAPRLTFDIKPSDGHVRFDNADQPIDVAYRNARINGQFADDKGTADLRFELGPNGEAEGQVTLGAQHKDDRALGGHFQARFPDLSLVSGFVPALEEVKGRMQLDAKLSGSLAKPGFSGQFTVDDASANVPPAGISIKDIQVALRGDGVSPLRVDASAHSGEGKLTLSGTVDLADAKGPKAALRIDGEHFQVAELPEANVTLSPTLRLDGNGPYHLSGTLLIPKAIIEVKELPAGTVKVSSDEVIVGANDDQDQVLASQQTPQGLTADVKVKLGDKVSFKGFGLTTDLVGAVDAKVGAQGTVVDGKIEMENGKYKAYGQDLTVEVGRLVFSGPPENPDVDLRAVRVSLDETVKAYLALQGPLSNPQARVYSEPSLTDGQALSYLLTGKSLDRTGEEEGINVANAALSLGLAKGEPLLQDLSSRVGLDDVHVESGSEGVQSSALVVGKYLNPDLYLGYSQGLFNPEGAVLLRLKLSKDFEVESRSGESQSVDLLYKLEYN